jgi:hypothetical protein
LLGSSSQKNEKRAVMKISNLQLLVVLVMVVIGCSSSSEEVNEVPKVTIISPEEGYIYIDGIYKGHKTPAMLILPKGSHVIGVAIDATKTYLRKEVVIREESMTVELAETDRPEPKIWKGLWVGIHEATNGTVSTNYTKEELDKAFEYFQWSVNEHFENYSYNTIKWELTRIDITEPVLIDRSGSNDVILPSSMGKLLPDEVYPGNYDNVFSFFKEKDDDCQFIGNYFALAWLDPFDSVIKTGYVTVKFDAEQPIEEHLNWYKENDPGVYCHEWLHTVGEYFFQSKGVKMPRKAPANNLMVHAADHVYGYTYPWLTWYQDVMAGRVKDGRDFVGIGPENFLKYNLRESALND